MKRFILWDQNNRKYKIRKFLEFVVVNALIIATIIFLLWVCFYIPSILAASFEIDFVTRVFLFILILVLIYGEIEINRYLIRSYRYWNAFYCPNSFIAVTRGTIIVTGANTKENFAIPWKFIKKINNEFIRIPPYGSDDEGFSTREDAGILGKSDEYISITFESDGVEQEAIVTLYSAHIKCATLTKLLKRLLSNYSRNPESFQILNCPKCDAIITFWEYRCPNCSNKLEKCIVCKLNIGKGDILVNCPACDGIAHEDEFLEWLYIKGKCPACNTRINRNHLTKQEKIV